MTEFMENPQTGERVLWHERTADTDGRKLKLEMWCKPGGGVLTKHIHPHGDERFEVLEGSLMIEIAGTSRVLGPGDRATVPAGVVHRWWTHGEDVAHAMIELDRPCRFEEQLETYYALGRLGHLRDGGTMSLPMSACLIDGDLESLRLPGPVPVQRVVLALLRRIAGLTGDAERVREARGLIPAVLAA